VGLQPTSSCFRGRCIYHLDERVDRNLSLHFCLCGCIFSSTLLPIQLLVQTFVSISSTWLKPPTSYTNNVSKELWHQNFPPIFSALRTGPNRDPERVMHSPIRGDITSYCMRNISSIFTAKLMLCTPVSLPPLQFLLLTDSLSPRIAMQDSHSSNAIVQHIHILLHSLTSSSSLITFLWIPGHINLPEYDPVDLAALQSVHTPAITDPLSSLASTSKPTIFHWSSLPGTAFGPLNPPTNSVQSKKTQPSSNHASRREDIILIWLRIGHTHLTHSFL